MLLCSIENHGSVHGDVFSLLGAVRSDGPIHGDVVSILGDVSLTGDGAITGDLVVIGGDLRKNAGAQLSREQVVLPFTYLLLPILVSILIVWSLTRLFHTRSYPRAGPFVR